MVTVGMNYEVREDKEKAFETRFVAVMELMGSLPGHLSTHLYTNVFQLRSYLIVSEWATRETFDAFVSSQAFKDVTDWGKEKILSARPRHDIYGSDSSVPSQADCPVDTANGR